ncbi:hypothetical protein WJX74_009646 [Apatococcus lobatus]|uniref:DUF155 domain-containing protein n=1 Tax=Apatococcus lobatus TaxID=904363 RepID=A0AAW1RZC7_9CHLO
MLNRGKDKKQSYLPVRSPSPQPSASARGSAPPLQRRQSPAPDQKRPKQQKNTIAPGQPAPGPRQREKFVSLPEELQEPLLQTEPSADLSHSVFEDLPPVPEQSTTRGRITIYCIAESLNRTALEKRLRDQGPKCLVQAYPDVLYGQFQQPGSEAMGDIFYFDYGCVVFWGLDQKQEQQVLRNVVVPNEENPLPPSEVEIDEFKFNYVANERPHIQNDTITINPRLSNDHHLKMSISFAFSQSTKLCTFEERVVDIVASTKDLPEILATTGKTPLSRKQIAQLIGKVFIQKSAVNLLSTVLDTPEFFWSAPDTMQALYKRVCEYVELDDRVEVLNNRFSVLQELLDMLRDHQNNFHTARLEWIVIWLIVVEVVVGLFECASILGWVGHA